MRTSVAAAMWFLRPEGLSVMEIGLVGRTGFQSKGSARWRRSLRTDARRWGSQSNDAEIRSLHQRVSAATNIPLPDADLQANGPVEAERIYEQAVMILRERTRESSAFPLAAAENAEYGFRRNLLGLRPLALFDAGVTLFAAVALLAGGHARFAVPAFASVVAIVLWLRLITPRWVRLAAERYADRLLGAAVALPSAETS
jgi:hypothetical protein